MLRAEAVPQLDSRNPEGILSLGYARLFLWPKPSCHERAWYWRTGVRR